MVAIHSSMRQSALNTDAVTGQTENLWPLVKAYEPAREQTFCAIVYCSDNSFSEVALLVHFLLMLSKAFEVDEEQIKRTLSTVDDMVNTRGCRAKTRLLSVDQSLDIFLDTFQNYFSYYRCDDREYRDTIPIAAFKVDALLSPSTKDFGFSRFPYEWKLDLQ